AGEARWVRVDPQLDEQHQRALSLDFSPLDVPHDRFVVAGDAWRDQRAGKLDPGLCGIDKYWGAWFIAANLVHDLAALNKQELLAWDIWGAAPRTEQPLTESENAWFDEIAAISSAPDGALTQIRQLVRSDARLRVPEQVFNVRRQREEHVVV
ncbi:MAG TPA: transglutaminase domain-containing protein, partial [Polyangiales bacterium]|nr:transglutaminase domain-containing protein [Polyangiales bacterium]